LYNEPTNAQLIDKLLYSYMFRHYCIIFRELLVSTCWVTEVCQFSLGDTYSARTSYEFPEDDTRVSKHVAAV